MRSKEEIKSRINELTVLRNFIIEYKTKEASLGSIECTHLNALIRELDWVLEGEYIASVPYPIILPPHEYKPPYTITCEGKP